MSQLSEQLRTVERQFVRQAVLLCGKHAVKQPVGLIDLAVQQQSAEPSPEASEEPAEEAPLSLTVDGKAIEPAAMEENGRLMLPLVETGEALGWTA